MKNKMCHIQKRFPEKSETIALIIAKDPEFRAICKDYDDCVHACRYWIQSKDLEAETRVDEYRTLVDELENEILETLSKHVSV